MATKRRRLATRQIGIPASAIAAWQAGDFHALNRALGVRPWQMAPWPLRMTPLGVDPRRPPDDTRSPWGESWQHACELQAALYEVAGEPPARLLCR